METIPEVGEDTTASSNRGAAGANGHSANGPTTAPASSSKGLSEQEMASVRQLAMQLYQLLRPQLNAREAGGTKPRARGLETERSRGW
eukprot:3101740-Pyramimonas_sp.AAC.2